MAEIPALYAQRPIVHRHAKAAMYHPFTEAMALTIVDIPVTLVIIMVFAIIIYFFVNLQKSAEQFFVFYLLITAVTFCMKSFFRALAAMFKRESAALSFSGLLTLALVLYTGYTVPKPTMIGALKWISWISVCHQPLILVITI